MRVKAFADEEFQGRITRVEPPVGYTTRTLEVRLRFDTGEEGLTQGMFSEVEIQGELLEDAISVPVESVIRTGAGARVVLRRDDGSRSEEHTSELQSIIRNSYAVFCLKK